MAPQSCFDDVPLAPSDTILGVQAKFVQDPHPDKISLIIGAYRDENGKPYVLPVVRKVETAMAADQTLNHEYLPMDGLKDLVSGAIRLALGSECSSITENRVCGIQSLSGTGALSICFQFLYRHYSSKIVSIPKPTWGNHKGILEQVGYKDVRTYRYLDENTQGIDIKGMIEDLHNMPDNSIVLLHACSQNPCGVDPSHEEWESIYYVIERKKMLPIFDVAYQGFSSGDIDKDTFALSFFEKRGMEMFICQSFAKIFGLYNERVGCLSAVCKNSEVPKNILSNLKIMARRNYSNPPNHGGRIVATILNDEVLYLEWKNQVEAMAKRVLEVREMLYNKLNELKTPGDWKHIIKQKGMFTFTGLNPKQISRLQDEYHIYMVGNGRINMCAVNKHNVDYIAKAFKNVVDYDSS